jgi:hypothetical protein
MPETCDYQLFGLRIRSEIPLPELFPVQRLGDPEVIISRGSIPAIQPKSGLQADGDGLLLNISDVARYQIQDGDKIIVDPAPNVPDRNVRLYLLGSAFGALLHQRGLLPLHANAIEIDGKAVAFMGPSGSGKSTLAAWFHDHGYRILADDVCVVGFDELSMPTAKPGLPRLRLWKKALEASGRDSADYHRAWEGSEQWDKFDVPLGQSSVVDEERVLKAIYLLKAADEPDIRPLTGALAAQALIENTYRGRSVRVAGGPRLHWQSCLLVAKSVPLFEFQRPWGLSRLEDDMSAMLSQLLSLEEKPALGSVLEMDR